MAQFGAQSASILTANKSGAAGVSVGITTTTTTPKTTTKTVG